MAVIVVEFAGIPGESTVSGFEEKVDALALREAIEVATPQASGRTRGARTVGQAKHSDIELVRYKDRASAKLAQACAAGENLGQVRINLFRTLEQGLVVYMTYLLDSVFVSRIEHDTLDGNGVVFQPHFVATSVTNPAPATGLASVLSGLARSQVGAIRMASRPATGGGLRGAPGSREVERVWLNSANVRWSYTPYEHGIKKGAIEKAWNIQTGVEA